MMKLEWIKNSEKNSSVVSILNYHNIIYIYIINIIAQLLFSHINNYTLYSS